MVYSKVLRFEDVGTLNIKGLLYVRLLLCDPTIERVKYRLEQVWTVYVLLYLRNFLLLVNIFEAVDADTNTLIVCQFR